MYFNTGTLEDFCVDRYPHVGLTGSILCQRKPCLAYCATFTVFYSLSRLAAKFLVLIPCPLSSGVLRRAVESFK